MRLPRSHRSRYLAAALLAAALGACVNAPPPPGPGFDPDDPQPDPTPGQTRFLSADYSGQLADDRFAGDDQGAPTDDEGGERAVEEGDIYRLLATRGLVANVNTYRGLQLIDVSDPESPAVVGGVRFAGEPVEMYAVGDRVYALLNSWRGYWGAEDLARPTTHVGGSVVVANVADETAPTIVQQIPVEGVIRTSRLVREADQTALYVVATDGQTTYVQSFAAAANGELAPKSRIELGGGVSDAQATPTRLLVASHAGDWQDPRSTVTIIDISDAQGAMVEGGSVTTRGYVESQFNMDLDADVLRLVSTSTWGAPQRTNHVETFDVSDIAAPTPLDSATFGDGEDLYATLFLGTKAFFVTFEVVDPFHAFEISPDGTITERAEFVVSGWNDFFKPAFDDARILGVGVDDREGFSLAVSLYDITNLQNPEPLLDRESIDLKWSWSEANWDHRAFTVLEGATSVPAPDGTQETGLVLLPFTGWDEDGYRSGVQIFSVSLTTVTRRGTMLQESPVRRSFAVDADARVVANLSDIELGMYDVEDPDAPAAQGTVELAPNYTDAFVVGDHMVRRRDRLDYYWWWYDAISSMTGTPSDTLEVVPLSGDVDRAAAVATIAVPAGTSLYQVGPAIVGLRWTWEGMADGADPRDEWVTELTVYDFSQPTTPRVAGSLTTNELPPPYRFNGYPEVPAVDVDVATTDARAQYYYPSMRFSDGIRVVGHALVLPEPIGERSLEGIETVTYRYPAYSDDDWADCWTQTGPAACTYPSGAIECRTLRRTDGTTTAETCTGAFYECEQDASGATACEQIDPAEVESVEYTWDHELYRYWEHYDLHVVDLSDPADPTLAPTVSMAANEEARGLLARDAQLFVSFGIPVNVPSDPRGFMRHYFRAIDLSDPQDPVTSASVNIPGVLVEVDDSLVVTRDWLWGENIAEAAIHRLTWTGDVAELRATYRFADQYVGEVRFDGGSHVLATHRAASWNVWGFEGDTVEPDEGGTTVSAAVVPNEDIVRLTILDLDGGGLQAAATVDVDVWATLTDATAGRGLFAVPGGLLVYNLDDPTAPYAQAFFALAGWPRDFERADRDVFFAAGRYGIYRFDLDQFNLLQP